MFVVVVVVVVVWCVCGGMYGGVMLAVVGLLERVVHTSVQANWDLVFPNENSDFYFKIQVCACSTLSSQLSKLCG